MYTIHENGTSPSSMSEQERENVRAQLARMLETHHFKNSRRYPPLLKFIVEETLEGRGEFLKERLLGIRVFDRPADYDTASDPIVRVTIAEIRKRIAQYYHDEEHDAEIRIELLPGRYAPEFRSRHESTSISKTRNSSLSPESPELSSLVLALPPQSLEMETGTATIPSRLYRRVLWVAGAASFLTLSTFLILRGLHPSAVSQLWAPLLTSRQGILFCVPTDVGKKRKSTELPQEQSRTDRKILSSAPGGPTFLDYEALGENIVYSDMLATLKIANVLATNHHEYRAKLNIFTNLEDLRQGPAILIGGLDNQWTMRALAPLRFHFEGSDEDRYWISDTKNPNDRRWSLDLKVQYAAVTRDYAVIARLHNDQTGQLEVIVAGIGMSGTAAAGEFITDERGVDELRKRIGAGFQDHDFEAVISTDVVNGMAGAPKIIAVAVW